MNVSVVGGHAVGEGHPGRLVRAKAKIPELTGPLGWMTAGSGLNTDRSICPKSPQQRTEVNTPPPPHWPFWFEPPTEASLEIEQAPSSRGWCQTPTWSDNGAWYHTCGTHCGGKPGHGRCHLHWGTWDIPEDVSELQQEPVVNTWVCVCVCVWGGGG